MYYIFIEDGKPNGAGQAQMMDDMIINHPVSKEVFEAYIEDTDRYVWDGEDIIENPNYEEVKAQKERERIAMLSLTKREVFLALYKAKQITPEILKSQIKDPEALIEIEYANEYYRGNPLIDVIGASLGITPKQLDNFFETNDYLTLI